MMGVIALRPPTTQDRVSKYTARFTLTLFGFCLAFVIFTGTYPWDPVTRLDIRVVGAPRVGDAITVEIDYCKSRAWVPTLVQWSLVNDIVIVLPATTMGLPAGCHVKRLSVPLPIHTVPGQYRLREELHYKPWPWKTILYQVESPTFTMGVRR